MGIEYVVAPTINYKRTIAPRGSGARSSSPGRESRTLTGISSVFGNVDAGRDVVVPGAFRKAIDDFNNGRSRARFLWNHNTSEPPTARILQIKELGLNDLPPALRGIPDVKGGLSVTREYFTDQYSDRIFQAVATGAITEMSFAYNVLDFEYEQVRGEKVRLLKNLELMDTSDVLWGMNAATMASVPKGAFVLTVAKVKELTERKIAQMQNNERLAQARYNIKHGDSEKGLADIGLWLADVKLRDLKIRARVLALRS